MTERAPAADRPPPGRGHLARPAPERAPPVHVHLDSMPPPERPHLDRGNPARAPPERAHPEPVHLDSVPPERAHPDRGQLDRAPPPERIHYADRTPSSSRPFVPPSARRSSRTPAPSTADSSEFLPAGGGNDDVEDRWLTDRIVTVVVGPQMKRWAVHEKLLCSKSKYFDDIFNGTDDEEPMDEVDMPHEDPKLFALLVRWLYGTAFANVGGTRIFRFSPPDGKEITVRDYIGLYVLGDKIGITGVKNAAIDALYAYFKFDDAKEKADDPNEVRCPDLEDVLYAFENTPADSHMRRLLIAHSLFHLFGTKRLDRRPLPPDWEKILRQSGEVGWEMIKMLSDWQWIMGRNVPIMRIKPRQEFHERIPGLQQGPYEDKIIKPESTD
ncbi:hypothetical protein B0H66DRAFT_627692 [Apodospora peruviana]|uniref:BTB domain-containing protein n=1 Tax=Apodospora peruviana TaxID=516989 RepID=A0AAE0HZP5_9PEZI|nr:hypothetical protein B0H66DRAFT_627692 [Apodospora peruviana]